MIEAPIDERYEAQPMIDLDAIRARDRDYDDVFDAQANMSKDIAHRLAAWPVADRRALLVAYDEARRTADYWKAELNAANKVIDALRAAAGKALTLLEYAEVSDNCQYGTLSTTLIRDSLADLRRLLGESHECT